MLKNNDPTELVLVLSDINMPTMSGPELLRIVKVKYPELKVYMITAYDDEKNRSTTHRIMAVLNTSQSLSISVYLRNK
jgi:DNA-binding NarL/FixJ family response regulator